MNFNASHTAKSKHDIGFILELQNKLSMRIAY